MTRRRVVLVRHGIRNFPEPHSHPSTPPVSPDPACLLLLASDENLNLPGHQFSFKLGRFIRKHYGKPNFIYGDVTTTRTIDTSISLGRGAGVNTIHLSTHDPDPYFQFPKTITPETISAANELLTKFTPIIKQIKQAAEQVQPCLKLADSSFINPATGEITGLVLQEYVLGSTMLLAEDSCIPSPLLKRRDTIAQIETITWTLRGPTVDTIRAPAEVLLAGVSHFLQEHELTVLVGHEHNVIQIAQLLGLGFKLPDYPELWVQPNSGFIFTLTETSAQTNLHIEIIFLTRDHKFKVRPYATIPLPTPGGTFNLVPKTINYSCHSST
jgi:hypothetical protein